MAKTTVVLYARIRPKTHAALSSTAAKAGVSASDLADAIIAQALTSDRATARAVALAAALATGGTDE